MIISRESTRFGVDGLHAACLATDEDGVKFVEGWRLTLDGPQCTLRERILCSPEFSQVIAVGDSRVLLSWHDAQVQFLELLDGTGQSRPIATTASPVRLLPGFAECLATGITVEPDGTSIIHRVCEHGPWLRPVATVPGPVRSCAIASGRLFVTATVDGRPTPMLVEPDKDTAVALLAPDQTGHVLAAGGGQVLLGVSTMTGHRLTLASIGEPGAVRPLDGPPGLGGAATPVAVDPTGTQLALVLTRGARSELVLYHWPSGMVRRIGPYDGELHAVAAWPTRGLWMPFSTPTEPPTFGWLSSSHAETLRGTTPPDPRWHAGRLETFPGPAAEVEAVVYGDWRTSRGVVVALHGGPDSRWSIGFEPLFQAFAARGLAVIAPNPRGSTGYGQRHAAAIVGSWGECDLADVRALAGCVLAGRDAGAQRPALFGSSYGAFLALLAAAADPDSWSACAVVAPFRSAATLYREADRPTRNLIDRLSGLVDANDDLGPRDLDLLAHRIRARTLVVHGALDETIPVGQSRVLVDRLVASGCDVTYHELANRGHNAIGTSPASAHVDMLARFLAKPVGVERDAVLASSVGAAFTHAGHGGR
jgi:pimeloyl-ACP methyl ester carboxylesterase